MLAVSSKLKPSACMDGADVSKMPVSSSMEMPVDCETPKR